jgi:hypothetical protein
MKTTVELVTDITYLDKQISEMIAEYNDLCDELLKRFPLEDLKKALPHKELVESDRVIATPLVKK